MSARSFALVVIDSDRRSSIHGPLNQPGREDVVRAEPAPDAREAVDALLGRVAREGRAVERADRAAEHDIGRDATLDE